MSVGKILIMKKVYISLLILSGALFSACNPAGVRIKGRFVGNDNKAVYLEMISPGRQSVVDSVSTDGNGFFEMKVKLPDGQPTIYNIICDGEKIPLLLSPREKVKLHSVGNVSRNYNVKGSEGSELMYELKNIISNGANRLDSILKEYSFADEELKRKLATEYNAEYYKTKREHIAFIVSNPGTLAALYALYQRLPNDPDLFNGSTDIIYYKLVADSVSKYYPGSPYVKALQKEMAAAESGMKIADLISEKIAEEPANFPDLNMSDMYGKPHRLSSLEGKVILLDFWSAASDASSLLNAELKEIYEELSGRGFEIYQVSVDESKSLWVNAVLEQKLPWISVSDQKGGASIAVRAYNVRNVPSNFLIDRNGDIADKNIYGDKLLKKVKELL